MFQIEDSLLLAIRNEFSTESFYRAVFLYAQNHPEEKKLDDFILFFNTFISLSINFFNSLVALNSDIKIVNIVFIGLTIESTLFSGINNTKYLRGPRCCMIFIILLIILDIPSITNRTTDIAPGTLNDNGAINIAAPLIDDAT